MIQARPLSPRTSTWVWVPARDRKYESSSRRTSGKFANLSRLPVFADDPARLLPLLSRGSAVRGSLFAVEPNQYQQGMYPGEYLTFRKCRTKGKCSVSGVESPQVRILTKDTWCELDTSFRPPLATLVHPRGIAHWKLHHLAFRTNSIGPCQLGGPWTSETLI
jgi:hypothetical protein